MDVPGAARYRDNSKSTYIVVLLVLPFFFLLFFLLLFFEVSVVSCPKAKLTEPRTSDMPSIRPKIFFI